MRLWIAILAVIVLIIAGGLWLEQSILKTTDHISRNLDLVKEAVRNSQWQTALEMYAQIETTWQMQKEHWTPLIHNHDIERVTIYLARLKGFLESEDQGPSLAEIAEMEIQLIQLHQQEVLTFKNVL